MTLASNLRFYGLASREAHPDTWAPLARLPGVAVWPFDPPDTRVVLAEVYPSLLAPAVRADTGPIKDEAQVRLLSQALWLLAQGGGLPPMLATPPAPVTSEEGWILGASFEAALSEALE